MLSACRALKIKSAYPYPFTSNISVQFAMLQIELHICTVFRRRLYYCTVCQGLQIVDESGWFRAAPKDVPVLFVVGGTGARIHDVGDKSR